MDRQDDRGIAELLAKQDITNAALMLSAAADITLVLNSDGMICDRVLANDELSSDLFMGWPGKYWSDTVTVESRIKVAQLMDDAGNGKLPRWRQVNHPVKGSADIPVRYMTLAAGSRGHVIAVGRDMRAIAELQQKLVEAEQSIEQEYARLRHSETRYRLLLQMASEAIIIVDARTGRVTEANPAAANILQKPQKRLTGAIFEDVFDGNDAEIIAAMLSSVRTTGRTEDEALALDGQQQAIASASLFRQENAAFVLFRLSPLASGSNGIVIPRSQSKVMKIIYGMPDGFVVTDLDRKILLANASFLEMAQLGSEEQVRGEPVERWLGRPGVDVNLMTGSMLDRGSIRQFGTIMRGQFGTTSDVEVSGVAVTDGPQPCLGFSIRLAARRPAEINGRPSAMLRSVDDLTKLVGKVPLKELVRESTDIIERLCIEAALQINGNNRANAADMLGLSRQSLYVKLHRYGIDG
jgi:transcriptional regulator PpsR